MRVACVLRSAFRPKVNWGERRWLELAACRPHWTFVAIDSEKQPALEVNGVYHGPRFYEQSNVLDLTGETPSARHALALLRECDAVVSVDTGLFHAAAGAQVPVVAMFGGGPDWARVPPGGAFRLIQGQASCYPCPCNQVQCERPADEVHCLAGVTGERVAREVEILWEFSRKALDEAV